MNTHIENIIADIKRGNKQAFKKLFDDYYLMNTGNQLLEFGVSAHLAPAFSVRGAVQVIVGKYV